MVAVVSSANVEAVALEAELDEVGACEKMAKARIANVDEGRGGGVCCCCCCCCCSNGNRPSSAWAHTPVGRCPGGTKGAFFSGGVVAS
jgi:hypothetical protein